MSWGTQHLNYYSLKNYTQPCSVEGGDDGSEGGRIDDGSEGSEIRMKSKGSFAPSRLTL